MSQKTRKDYEQDLTYAISRHADAVERERAAKGILGSHRGCCKLRPVDHWGCGTSPKNSPPTAAASISPSTPL